ncbi:crotonobetainyl-CoA:carnitine CoA-transferase CaiB-like acyl-CoA transferase [Arthrobacter bambusae]|uniref:Crotonobetainyl-CoA:carnitine CoA-transferase CaiB-like acyl-CoA transferase n=1 Tax=Arthrobacter bambusae TaxID=1338426 RepID=A0AAW8DNR9_9MICC|nr:CoA transferase [Arthrobacter bambusae]MDP9907902.1 crotonobetainyl-CoA:carnitine CoA-transferase CaiB-like acyl-CoA transferase [Arthrobacter bambusae]MDQ0132094.1 crotonobetainyl-CoA:carnitine CoA-transferase CaiB-like acyl-CoA transferase [Arthrobacter bambusae]MDQ0183435.1 crotonobetainyl-CoA:carnitine CoA-transferase CaiB-like acyl-CoA transferase [Arthrobacter bambusae]
MESTADSRRGLPQPLAGIRIADFSRVLAGPLCSMMLADYGADVIKIESPAGDDTRAWVPPMDIDGTGTYFASVNRNKRSVVADLKSDEGLSYARALVAGCDVVIENFRPGVMAKFGLDYQTVSESRPDIVYCSISGFGAGAGADLPGYDLLVQALGGLMSITGQADGEPSKVGVALVDVLTGQNALAGILMALRVRDATGTGQQVQINLFSSLLAALVNQATATLATGCSPARLGNAHPSIAPYETFRTGGGMLAIAVGNDRQFAALASVLGLKGLPEQARFFTNERRVASREELRIVIETALDADTAANWQRKLLAAGVPAGRVNSVGEAFELAERLGLEPSIIVTDPATGRSSRQLTNPIRLSASAPSYRQIPPDIGEHQGSTFAVRPPNTSAKGT